ncbi:hypothetical protein I7X12_13250 [Halosimplex litoreum]|uniref:Uncharacterized protein n=1 Tax=Halosimplex litoreum TaxID=1198301 RepID=A0A7T3FW18_9EURY|nr:DUF6684 family protein [Halosimplex litoreum]QPV61715.1 hypothetical protein I7X12_13250 [Halosimplex litoreum]
MSVLQLTEETWLDLTVNFVPIGILAVLDVMFWVYNPWGWDLWFVFWAHVLTVVPLVLLTLLTYVSGRVIQRDERAAPSEAGAGAEPEAETEVGDG